MLSRVIKRAVPVAALGLALSGCAFMTDWNEVSGVPLAELDTSGEPPTKIGLAGPDRVVLSQGDGLTITLDGNAKAGEALRFDRDSDRLTIARDSDIWDGSGKAIVRITMPPASALEIAGSGFIEADTVASEAELEIAGSGDISVATIDAERLLVEIAGSGEVEAAGAATTVEIEIAGSGDVNMANLLAETVTVGIAGSGDVDIASNGTVDAEIAGSGDVVVFGDASCSVETAGSGSVTCKPAPSAATATEPNGTDAAAD